MRGTAARMMDVQLAAPLPKALFLHVIAILRRERQNRIQQVIYEVPKTAWPCAFGLRFWGPSRLVRARLRNLVSARKFALKTTFAIWARNENVKWCRLCKMWLNTDQWQDHVSRSKHQAKRLRA